MFHILKDFLGLWLTVLHLFNPSYITFSYLNSIRSKKLNIILTYQEELRKAQAAEREKRAAAAERRLAAAAASKDSVTNATPSNSSASNALATDATCSCCSASLAGKVPFHRYSYKYCSTSCMFVHKEIIEDG